MTGQLGDKSIDHPVHKAVKEVSEQYQSIDDSVKARGDMLEQFKPRVAEYEGHVREFTEWLTDCCKRTNELPVADMSTEGLHSQLTVVEVSYQLMMIILYTAEFLSVTTFTIFQSTENVFLRTFIIHLYPIILPLYN